MLTRRLYFPSSGAAAFTPAFDSAWYDTAGADRVAAVWDTPSGTAFTARSVSGPALPGWPGFSFGEKILVRQYVSPAFSDTTTVIGGSGTGVFRAGGTSTGGGGGGYAPREYSCLVGVRLFSATGTLKGTLSPPMIVTAGLSAFATLPALVRRKWNVFGSPGPGLAVAVGDRLVVELGYVIVQSDATAITSYSGSMEFGDASASNLTYGDAAVDDGQKNPWALFTFSGGTMAGGFTGAQIL